jgi:hypothetical protein
LGGGVRNRVFAEIDRVGRRNWRGEQPSAAAGVPQWQGAGSSEVRALAPQSPFDVARRGYTVGTTVLDAVVSASAGPTAVVLG